MSGNSPRNGIFFLVCWHKQNDIIEIAVDKTRREVGENIIY